MPKGNLKNLTPGNPLATGRPPNWLKQKCQDIVDKRKLIDFLGSVAGGEKVDYTITAEGTVVEIPAKVTDRIAATKDLLDRGWCKPTQGLVNMQFVLDFIARVVECLARVLPDRCPHCAKILDVKNVAVIELETLAKSVDDGVTMVSPKVAID